MDERNGFDSGSGTGFRGALPHASKHRAWAPGRMDALSDIARRARAMHMDAPLEFHRCRQQAGSIDATYCVNYAP